MQHKQIFPSNTTTCGQINLLFQSITTRWTTKYSHQYEIWYLQTQMDTGKKKATKGNLWVEIPLKKKIYIYIYIYILSFTFSPFVLDDYATGSHHTSHWMFSLAMHRGKYLLAWRIHPWQSSAPIARQPAFIASWRGICSYGRWSYTFHLQAEKNSSIGFRKGEYGREELHHNTRLCCKPFIHKARVVESNIVPIMTYRLMPGLNSPLSSGGISISFNASRNVMRRSVLYGPIVGMWQRTPSLRWQHTWWYWHPSDLALWQWPSAQWCSSRVSSLYRGWNRLHPQKWICDVPLQLQTPLFSKKKSKFIKQIIPVACNYGKQVLQ